jgi:hypothetical protein
VTSRAPGSVLITPQTDLHDAWEQVHAAKPAGWFVGQPDQRYGGEWAVRARDG